MQLSLLVIESISVLYFTLLLQIGVYGYM